LLAIAQSVQLNGFTFHVLDSPKSQNPIMEIAGIAQTVLKNINDL
jgi:hypothetical protein